MSLFQQILLFLRKILYFSKIFSIFCKICISADFLFLRKFFPLIFVFFILLFPQIFSAKISISAFFRKISSFSRFFCANFLFQKIFDIFVAIFLVSADFLFFANRFRSADFFISAVFLFCSQILFFCRYFSFEQIFFLFLSQIFFSADFFILLAICFRKSFFPADFFHFSRFFYFFRKTFFPADFFSFQQIFCIFFFANPFFQQIFFISADFF